MHAARRRRVEQLEGLALDVVVVVVAQHVVRLGVHTCRSSSSAVIDSQFSSISFLFSIVKQFSSIHFQVMADSKGAMIASAYFRGTPSSSLRGRQ